MCIAIYKPKGISISKETLQQCFKSNSDGAGFMYAHKKELHMQKGFFTFDEFWEEYAKHQEKQAVIHFRIKTHGPINEENCHPFLINNALGFVHNGVISGFGIQDKSDTNHFNEEILQPLVSKWGNLSLFQPAMKQLIESRIGYSKLIFLDRHGNYDIFNEDKGTWDKGVWYSNNSYKPYIPPPPQTYKPYGSPPQYVPPGQSALTAPKPKAPVTSYLKEGDLVKLTREFIDFETKQKFKKGEIFEVIAVNSYYTCDLMLDYEDDPNKAFVYNVPFTLLELILEDEEFFMESQSLPWYN